jgi:hypothetical protein
MLLGLVFGAILGVPVGMWLVHFPKKKLDERVCRAVGGDFCVSWRDPRCGSGHCTNHCDIYCSRVCAGPGSSLTVIDGGKKEA